MRLITKYNNLLECHNNLQCEFARIQIENAGLLRLYKESLASVRNANSSLQYLKNKISDNPESILYHMKLSKIENYIRKSKLRRITSK